MSMLNGNGDRDGCKGIGILLNEVELVPLTVEQVTAWINPEEEENDKKNGSISPERDG